jgi:hypothetical protein
MLSAVRRVGVSAGAKLARGPAKYGMCTFNDRERGLEAKFIRDEEEKRRVAHRAELERILALEDGHHEKAALTAVLGKKINIIIPLQIQLPIFIRRFYLCRG